MNIFNNLRCVYLMYNSKLQHLIKKKEIKGKKCVKVKKWKTEKKTQKLKNGN